MRQNKVKDFDILKTTIDDIHALGKKAYLTMNIFPRNSDMGIFESVVERISNLNIDAIIFSDPGTYTIIKKYLPNVRLHLSTQANTLNYEAIRFRYDLGVHRVVLARELTLQEIKTIKEKVPEMELEVFVHGSMCMAYSGRCLLGEYFAGRDGNR
ncbi:U32 family peptidase [Patescibacteria group bacterium]|mgnify:FL=1|nr:U32 family peptidase [Patescibacteria group bacterium]MBP7841949.1 U32 family peptidase [Patescibacteria group bacterium]